MFRYNCGYILEICCIVITFVAFCTVPLPSRLSPPLGGKLRGQSSTSTYKLEERLPLSLYRGSRRIYPCFSRSCSARLTVEREQLSSAAMVFIPGQHLRSLSDRSRRYIYTVLARMGRLLSEYIVEKYRYLAAQHPAGS